MNQKIDTKLGTVIILIIAITFGMFVWKYEMNQPELFDSQALSQPKKTPPLISVSDKWTLVSHGNYWSNPNLFANRNYNFPDIEFSYPNNWKFQCCNDTDYASIHIIYSSEEKNMSLPYIRITNYYLMGCASQQKSCSLDKRVLLTASKKFNQLIATIPAPDILPAVKLENLKTSAFTYRKTEQGDKSLNGYIINLQDSVVEVDFINYELLDNDFIKSFLNHITFEKK